jgi:hypothetical protein
MDQELEERRRTVEQVRARFDPRAADTDPAADDDAVRRSWLRCAPTLAPEQTAAPLDDIGTADDRWEASPIRRAWPGLVDELRHIAEDGDLVAAVTDEDGRILWSWGGRWMRDRAESVNFGIGGRWDEPSAGTNAVGMSLITGEPSTVFAVEHWCEAVHDWVCYSAPVRDAAGDVLGIIDLSSTWDHANPLGLPAVTAFARVVELETRWAPRAARRRLDLRLLGRARATMDGTPVLLTPRQLEILTVLAGVGEATLDQLHALLHGDRIVSPTTTKVEVSQIRRALGGVIASRPYRFTVDVEVDALDLLGRLERGDLAGATALYRGQLLPQSDAPYVVEQRHLCDVALRTALLRGGTTAQLLVFADTHPYDLEVLERAVAVAAPDDLLLPRAAARLAIART